ncbi:MAG: glycosyltransferase, partial [Alphaproteobacteria bacterium]|nr:glycosyltransferase [Alphaproteobacteria bacterium]
VDHGRELHDLLPQTPTLIVTHTILPPDLAQGVARKHRLAGFVHMPLADRDPSGLVHYHHLFAVSAYVRATILARGHRQVHDEPLLGVADLKPRAASGGALIRRSEYDWDYRKVRDRVLSWIEPVVEPLRPHPTFVRRPGLTLGIVSRLTPIKQFPLLFSHLAPVLAGFPEVRLEIFGSGGYASVRDLKQALAPIRPRVRFWGLQPDPASIYPQLDYVLSGLPEKEALGLNLIEAQACGTPVLAVDAPPFDETVVPGQTGFLYTDPRQDAAASFRALLASLLAGRSRPQPRQATAHLERFSPPAFAERVGRVMESLVR